jgi:NADPH:quinone reductase-like Zn-dependent oxidoreductase
MRALVLTGFGGADAFEWTTAEALEPAPGQLLVRVHGTSVNRSIIRRGVATTETRSRCRRLSVRTCQVSSRLSGPRVRDFAVGDEVFDFPPAAVHRRELRRVSCDRRGNRGA